MEDIWFDDARFIASNKGIQILHSNAELNEKEYDFVLGGKTFVLDISKPENEIWLKLENKSCRYAINRALRYGVTVKKVESEEERNKYLDFQNNFCQEKGIPSVSRADIDELDVYYAEDSQGDYLGGCAFLKSQDHKTVRYKYGATVHRLRANEAILWKAICEYHVQGYENFDFGGCIPTEDRESYYYRHFEFKKKFGGELVESYTYFKIHGIYRVGYWLFSIVLKLCFKNDLNQFVIWLNKLGMIR